MAVRTGEAVELEVESVEPDGLGADWDVLASAAGNPFATRAWLDAWLEHGGVACTQRIFAARRVDGSLAAILPLAIVHGRYARKARFLGFGAANRLGPVCAPTDLEAAARALRRALETCRREWDIFVGESLPGVGWARRLRAAPVARIGNPVVRGGWTTWDEYLAARSQNFRQDVRRKERKLLAGGMTYSAVERPEELDGALDALFRLHRARWGDEASPWFAGRETLHRTFAAAALEAGWLRLRLARIDGRTVGAYLGFRFGEVEWFYQLGRDTEAEGGPIGFVLVAHSLRESIGEGAVEFDLGPGAQPYKLRFASDDVGVETVAIPQGLRGRASLLAARRRGA